VGRVHEALDLLRELREPVEAAIAEAGGITDFAGIYTDVAAGRLQVFGSGRSVVLTEIQQYRKEKVLQLCYGAGALDEMEPWVDALFEWARSKGCTKVVMLGRKGWERSFLGKRLRPTHILLEGQL
jgi:hypothetical protein